ncbi:hypothetical protein AB205_0043980, partial [Aquarana catesbeiana]
MGGLLKPTVSSQNTSAPSSKNQPGKLVSDDLDSSLANLVGNLGIGNGTTKNDVHWIQPGEKKLTGGTNWQPKLAPTTTWNPATLVMILLCNDCVQEIVDPLPYRKKGLPCFWIDPSRVFKYDLCAFALILHALSPDPEMA